MKHQHHTCIYHIYHIHISPISLIFIHPHCTEFSCVVWLLSQIQVTVQATLVSSVHPVVRPSVFAILHHLVQMTFSAFDLGANDV